jgi:hypothetical protein
MRPWAFSAASISFLTPGVSPSLPVVADHHDWVKVMRLGAVGLALGDGQLDLGHRGIISRAAAAMAGNDRAVKIGTR